MHVQSEQHAGIAYLLHHVGFGIKLRLAGSVASVYLANHLASQGLVLMTKCFKIVIKVVRTYLGHQNECT